MAEWINILFKAFFCGCAALGFAILFNVQRKNLAIVWIGGVIVGLVKFSVLQYFSASIIFASFLASLTLGIYSLITAQRRQEPLIIFAIPSVIPLVPGVFAYRTMFGLIELTRSVGPDFSRTLSETVHNSVLTLFIVMAFSIGIVIPYLIGKDLLNKAT
ncbi:MAG: threonine/serine exporter [Bacteroidetes bacterium]|nr:MAG: threonine/serine exporter [Bacteroidota bacterium]